MVMQKQQQEMMARKEAEARGGYPGASAHMMQVQPPRTAPPQLSGKLPFDILRSSMSNTAR